MSDQDPTEPTNEDATPGEADPASVELSEEEAKKQAIKERNAKWQENADQHTHMGYPF